MFARLSLLALAISGCAPVSAAHYERAIQTLAQSPEAPPPPVFGDALERSDLIAAVLKVNPTVEAARQAWQAALAQHPVAVASADPTLTWEMAPATIGSPHAFGQTIRIAQRFQTSGKQGLRGAMVMAEAEARQADVETVRQRLALVASWLYDTVHETRQSLELLDDHTAAFELLRASADARYASGRASRHDLLEAEVELARIDQQRIHLRAELDHTTAQLNGLLHRAPSTPLPSFVVAELTVPETEAAPRPELAAQQSRIRAAAHGVELARAQFAPDVGVMATYSSMWSNWQHQLMVGVTLDIPLQLKRRKAAVSGARASLAQAEAQAEALQDDIAVQIEQSRLRLREARDQVALLDERLLPIAREHIVAAEDEYLAGRGRFSEWVAARHQLHQFEQQRIEAAANTWRRYAELLHALGRVGGEL